MILVNEHARGKCPFLLLTGAFICLSAHYIHSGYFYADLIRVFVNRLVLATE